MSDRRDDVLRYAHEMREWVAMMDRLKSGAGMELVIDGVWRVRDGTALVKLTGRCEVGAAEYAVFPAEVEVIEGALQPLGSVGTDPSGYVFEPVMPSKPFWLTFYAERELWERGKTGTIIVSYLKVRSDDKLNAIDWVGVKHRMRSMMWSMAENMGNRE